MDIPCSFSQKRGGKCWKKNCPCPGQISVGKQVGCDKLTMETEMRLVELCVPFFFFFKQNLTSVWTVWKNSETRTRRWANDLWLSFSYGLLSQTLRTFLVWLYLLIPGNICKPVNLPLSKEMILNLIAWEKNPIITTKQKLEENFWL